MARRYYSGVDKRAVDRTFLVIFTFVIIPTIIYVGYIFFKFGLEGFSGLGIGFLTCSGTIAIIIGIVIAAFVSSKRDQWKSVRANRKKNYCVMKRNGSV